jgi:hypothetical protein
LKRCGVHRDIAFDKGYPFLRKILFRAMAGASAIGGIDFHTLFAHRGSPPLRGCDCRGDFRSEAADSQLPH